MKTLVSILAFLNGGYMLLDGIFVLMKGKYIGPEKPGPWAKIFYQLDVNVFKLGPLFIAFGIAWIIWLAGFLTNQGWAYAAGIVFSILTLWYLPAGTLFSLIILLVLFFARKKIGL